MNNKIKASFSPDVSEREAKHSRISLEIASEGIVLLKNDGVLPLKPCKTALYGAGADKTIKGGSGSGEVNERHSITVKEGLENHQFTITTIDWIKRYEEEWKAGKEEFNRSIAKRIRKMNAAMLAELMSAEYQYPFGGLITKEDIETDRTDICIYVVSRQSGEGKDRKLENYDYSISPIERDNLKICTAKYRKVIVILNVGAAFDTSFMDEISGINALIYMCQLGMNGGQALADVFTGTAVPSGKLTATWPVKYEDIPFGDEYSSEGAAISQADYKEGIFVGYRYFDSFGVTPAYEFGYGLSYTSFQWSNERIRIEGTLAEVTAEVENAGTLYPGKEVMQLYVSPPNGNLQKEYQRLAAFQKTALLSPGEKQEVKLSFSLADIASYSEEKAAFLLEPGDYILRLGNSSRNTRVIGEIRLEEELILFSLKNLCKCNRQIDEIQRETSNISEVTKTCLQINLASVVKEASDSIKYKPFFSDTVREFLKNAKVDELIELVVGAGLFPKKPYFEVPGAVGNTTSALAKSGISNVALADGPAGLRLQKRSTISKSGKIKMVDAPISLYEMFPAIIKKAIFGNPEKETVIYQYTTAFPVGIAVAQTWNTDLAIRMGDAVGREMTEFGVTFWLAPGMNLIRNPLCGRNYEYYSEDPLLTGKIASAICSGVQKNEGKYATIKHVAANNQEENRYLVSSNMTERTLRELYLKGFEIVVKEAKPKAIMMAYNQINGVPCSNHQELCTQILRQEWGHEGIIMTDWLATSDQTPATDEGALLAGIDLIMPGSRKCKKNLKRAVKHGKLPREVLEESAGRVLASILGSKVFLNKIYT